MSDSEIREPFAELVESLSTFAQAFENHLEEPDSEEQRRRLTRETGFLRSVLTDVKKRLEG